MERTRIDQVFDFLIKSSLHVSQRNAYPPAIQDQLSSPSTRVIMGLVYKTLQNKLPCSLPTGVKHSHRCKDVLHSSHHNSNLWHHSELSVQIFLSPPQSPPPRLPPRPPPPPSRTTFHKSPLKKEIQQEQS